MKKFIMILIMMIPAVIYSQADLRAGMGIYFTATPSLRDYLNQSYRTGEEISSFNSGINFSGEADYYFNESFAGGIELAYTINSFSFSSDIQNSELAYTVIMPSLTAYYVISGTGYNFKLGGGAGFRLASVNEDFPLESREHSSTGIGFLLRADGNTLLAGSLYANIGADLRYDLNGSFSAYRRADDKIKLDSFSAGLRLGITYIIN